MKTTTVKKRPSDRSTLLQEEKRINLELKKLEAAEKEPRLKTGRNESWTIRRPKP
jgi:hypothetical protein